MTDLKITYRGIEVPTAYLHTDPLPGFGTWVEGVDSALGTGQAEVEAPDPYEYFHDDDELGSRYYRRILRGRNKSTAEILRDYQAFSETAPYWRVSEDWTVPREELEDAWVKVPASEVPTKFYKED